MSKSKQETVQPPTLLWIARAMLLVAAGFAGFLALSSLEGGVVAGCGEGEGCNQVLSSRWAYWFNLPVGSVALAAYVSLLALSTGLKAAIENPKNQAPRLLVPALALSIFGAAVWFVGLQAAVVGSYCKFCLGAHALGSTGASLLLVWIAKSFKASPSPDRVFSWSKASAFAAVCVAVLVAGQFAHKEKAPELAVTTTSVKSIEPPKPRFHSLHNGAFKFNLDEMPMLGSRSSTNIVVAIFDYTCKHCRKMHPYLQKALTNYPGEFAIIAAPMPLDSHCNDLVRKTHPDHQGACDYARLGLAVAFVKKEAYPEFDEYLFSGERPPLYLNALLKAQTLVGTNELAAALTNSWVSGRIKEDIDLYKTNKYYSSESKIPQTFVGETLVSGLFPSYEVFTQVLETNLLRRASAPAAPKPN